MIHSFAITADHQIIRDFPLEQLIEGNPNWFWVDFDQPTEEEARLLDEVFHFHPLAIEDCLHFLQRPKLDHYKDYAFLVVHALNPETLEAEEVDLFLGPNFLVTFHNSNLKEMSAVRERLAADSSLWSKGVIGSAYLVMDHLVDQYFPSLYAIEDRLNELEDDTKSRSVQQLMDKVFDIRSDLLKLRRMIVPMRDLFYRIVHTDVLPSSVEHRVYFTDVYDHLMKLSEMIDSNREITADMRDSYLSLNTNRLNTIMMTLTVITTIFMPLTFVAGIYGMNFENMPELKWKYGYYLVLAVMGVIALSMFWWFKRKGWFNHK